MLVKKEMLLAEVVERWPETIQVIMDYGLHCVGCYVSSAESIEDGCKVHGMSDIEVGHFLRDLNKVVRDVEGKKVKA